MLSFYCLVIFVLAAMFVLSSHCILRLQRDCFFFQSRFVKGCCVFCASTYARYRSAYYGRGYTSESFLVFRIICTTMPTHGSVCDGFRKQENACRSIIGMLFCLAIWAHLLIQTGVLIIFC